MQMLRASSQLHSDVTASQHTCQFRDALVQVAALAPGATHSAAFIVMYACRMLRNGKCSAALQLSMWQLMPEVLYQWQLSSGLSIRTPKQSPGHADGHSSCPADLQDFSCAQ